MTGFGTVEIYGVTVEAKTAAKWNIGSRVLYTSHLNPKIGVKAKGEILDRFITFQGTWGYHVRPDGKPGQIASVDERLIIGKLVKKG
jgi:hypothetical protein